MSLHCANCGEETSTLAAGESKLCPLCKSKRNSPSQITYDLLDADEQREVDEQDAFQTKLDAHRREQ